MTRARVGLAGTPGTEYPAAHSMPARTSGVEAAALAQHPHRQQPHVRPTLAMPMPLLVRAAINPAVCVPCQELLVGAGCMGRTRRLFARVPACVTESPGWTHRGRGRWRCWQREDR